MASLGASLALCDINYDNLESTKKACSSTPTYLEDVDVSDVKEVTQFIETTVKKLGGLHHVFNCAGINPTSIPLEETTDEYWDKLVSVNLKGVFNVTRAAVKVMGEGGSFVNVRSVFLLSLKQMRDSILR